MRYAPRLLPLGGDMSEYKRSTLAAQALGWREASTHGLVPPIMPSVPNERNSDGAYPGGHTYTRDQNPTYDQAEALLARLEGGAGALLFSSGMAAVTTVFETLAYGDHVVAPAHMYWTIRQWLQQMAASGRITLDLVPNGDHDALRALMRPGRTKIVWAETPSNPMCAVEDIAACAEIAHAVCAHLVVDSTVATPVLCQPLALGADVVMHSATKQLNGHSGCACGRTGVPQRGRPVGTGPARPGLSGGGGRSVRGLAAPARYADSASSFLRVPAAAHNAQRVAEMLATHPAVVEVLYPGLPQHPGHTIAKRQMVGGFGMILSFRPAGGEAAARRLVAALKVFRNATSLGGVESLVEHRFPVEGPSTSVPRDLIRLSLGIEDPDDLLADLEQALAAVRQV